MEIQICMYSICKIKVLMQNCDVRKKNVLKQLLLSVVDATYFNAEITSVKISLTLNTILFMTTASFATPQCS